eukprot:TRINITY_DN12835_c0_g1_i1.p1 TRINITY_DN12835_c0_g1~~TRINITY_DN12835_c0_g1_i1.p1  ORF type:complete len:176 (-),score=24.31 TRINITY_DN12835_c0_g1_i1:90-539(-)
MSTVASDVNQLKKTADASRKLRQIISNAQGIPKNVELLQPSRHLDADFPALVHVNSGKPKKCQVLCFNDCVVVFKAKSKSRMKFHIFADLKKTSLSFSASGFSFSLKSQVWTVSFQEPLSVIASDKWWIPNDYTATSVLTPLVEWASTI